MTDPGIEMTAGGAGDGGGSADLFSKFDPLIQQRETLLETGLTDPFNLVMERVVSPTVAVTVCGPGVPVGSCATSDVSMLPVSSATATALEPVETPSTSR